MKRPTAVRISQLLADGAIVENQDGNHGEIHPKAGDYVPDGIPFIMCSDLKGGTVDLVGCKKIREQQASRLRVGFAKAGDVLLSHKGTVGLVAMAPRSAHPYLMLTPQVTYYRVNHHALNPRYLAFAFRTPDFQHQLTAFSAQSTRPFISISAQRQLAVLVHERRTQDRIADILSAYDNLIEGNSKRIKILEEMARSLYNEWFVNFLFPGHEKVKIASSRLGKVPQGWGVAKLGDLVGVNERSIRRGAEPAFVDYVDISSVSPGRIEKSLRYAFPDAPGRARRLVQDGDTIWSMVRPNHRAHAFVVRPSPDVVVSTGFAVITPKRLPTAFTYLAVTTDAFVAYLVNHARGAAYPAVAGEDFKSAPFLLPSIQAVERFEALALPMLLQVDALQRQSAVLAQTRDLLLPRLISGEIALDAIADNGIARQPKKGSRVSARVTADSNPESS